MNYLNYVKNIYMHMYMCIYISMSISLCSGAISQKKYKVEIRIHHP